MNEIYMHSYYDPEWVMNEIKRNKYFGISEFVSDAVLSKYGEAQCWSFLDPRLLANLLYIRTERGNPITINHGEAQQRGLRENLCPIVRTATNKNRLYLSAHTRGCAVDFHEQKETAEQIRQWIVTNGSSMPYPCRLEWKKDGEYITWVHMDVSAVAGQNRVHLFNV